MFGYNIDILKLTQNRNRQASILMLIAFSASSAKQKFQSEQGMRRLNRLAAIIMVSTGVFLSVS
jgi:arginine exporter protein ArgO